MLLGFSDVIFVGIWAHNWIWSKTFPSSIFCDGSISSGWACHNRGFFNSQKLKPQILTWAGKGFDFWIADPIYLASKIYTSSHCRPHTSHSNAYPSEVTKCCVSKLFMCWNVVSTQIIAIWTTLLLFLSETMKWNSCCIYLATMSIL